MNYHDDADDDDDNHNGDHDCDDSDDTAKVLNYHHRLADTQL